MSYMDSAFESPVYGRKLLENQGMDPGRLLESAPMDDGVAPVGPTGFKLTPFLASIYVEWDTPPATDHVASTIIEYTPAGGTLVVVETTSFEYTITELAYVAHTVRIKHRDLWGLESEWSAPLTTTPLETADYAIDLEKARQRGNLQNLMPAINAALISGENFAADSVKAVSLAQGESNNMLPLIMVDYEQWPAEMAWPPTESDVNGVRYINSAFPTGSSAKVVDRSGSKWLQLNRGSSTDAWMIPVTNRRRYGMFAGEDYIYSVWVQGTAGQSVQLRVRAWTAESGGTSVEYAGTPAMVLDGSAEGQRFYFKFTQSSTHPWVEFYYTLGTNPQTIHITRHQLEHASGKSEPSAWTAGVITTGVLVARSLQALDVAATNALFKNAAIESAKIKDLTADKIVSGSISTALLELVNSGRLKAGRVFVDSGGITMDPLAVYNQVSTNKAYKISSTDDLSAINFYNDGSTATSFRGIVMRADGGNTRGIIALQASDDNDINGQGGIQVELVGAKNATPSGYGRIRLINGQFYRTHVAKFSIAANTTTSITHNMGHEPTVFAFYTDAPEGWRLLPTSPGSSGIDIFLTNANATKFQISNLSGATHTIYGTFT